MGKYIFSSDIDIQKLLLKTYNKPSSIKDHLYENLSFIDKIKLFTSNHCELLKLKFPILFTIINILEIIINVLMSIVYFIGAMFVIDINVALGFSLVILNFLVVCSLIYHVISFSFDNYEIYQNSIIYYIMYYITGIVLLSIFIKPLFIIIRLFLFGGLSKIKKYINNNIERKFCNKLNRIYYTNENDIYLEHELIKNVQAKQNKISYDKQSIGSNLIRIYERNYHKNDNQKQKAVIRYIDHHTNRELNFKQLLFKLSYLNQKTMLDYGEKMIDQDEKVNEIIKEIMNSQKSKEELLKDQFEN